MANELDDQSSGGGWGPFKDGGPPKQEGRRDIAPRVAVALLALAAAIVFVAQNSNRVETTFLFFEGSARLWIVIVVSLLLGGALGQAVGLMHRRRKKT